MISSIVVEGLRYVGLLSQSNQENPAIDSSDGNFTIEVLDWVRKDHTPTPAKPETVVHDGPQRHQYKFYNQGTNTTMQASPLISWSILNSRGEAVV